ncbi:MAG: glycosyltransferase family A protein [bacterium]
MISIIVPIYNMAKKLPKLLDSLLEQDYQDYELILVDDGSIDDIEKVFNEYDNQFSRLRIVRQDNLGSNPARNRGAVGANGAYLLFCDADIIMQPSMLKEMKHALDTNPEASFAYCSFKLGAKVFRLWPYDLERLKKMPYIHTTSLIRAEHFPGFDNQIKRLQDWDLWLTMAEQGRKGIWINKILFTAQPGGSISSWLPSFAYKLMPFLSRVKKYQAAVEIIKQKHSLK